MSPYNVQHTTCSNSACSMPHTICSDAACSIQRAAYLNVAYNMEVMRHTTCSMQHTIQHATCNMTNIPYRTCNMQHTTCSMQHTTCSMQHNIAYNIQHAICNIRYSVQHTTYSNAAYNVQHATCTIQRAACSVQHANNPRATRSMPHAAFKSAQHAVRKQPVCLFVFARRFATKQIERSGTALGRHQCEPDTMCTAHRRSGWVGCRHSRDAVVR